MPEAAVNILMPKDKEYGRFLEKDHKFSGKKVEASEASPEAKPYAQKPKNQTYFPRTRAGKKKGVNLNEPGQEDCCGESIDIYI